MPMPSDRRRHWLRPNDGSRTPQCVITVACEPVGDEIGHTATSDRNRLWLGVACYQRIDRGKGLHTDWLEFSDPAEFWAWVESKQVPRRATWIVSSHLFRDLTLLRFWEALDARYFTLVGDSAESAGDERGKGTHDYRGFTCLGDPPTIVLAKRLQFSLTMVDLRNYFPSSETELGVKIDAPMLPRPNEEGTLDDWIAYTSRRCRIAQESLLALIETWKREDLGVWQFTLAGLSMRAYRHRFMVPRSILIDDHGPATDLGREALAGGEARCWYVGDVVPPEELGTLTPWEPAGPGPRRRAGPVYVVDVTSYYGAMMRSNLFPRELAAWKAAGCIEDLQVWRKQLCLVARVEVESPTQTYPYLHPGQDRRERYWAVGRYWTTLAGPELCRALDAGCVRSVGPVAAYLPGRLFARYVDYFWRKRTSSQGADREMYKLLLVALPGKFGQRTPRWQETGEELYEQRWGPLIRGHAQREGVDKYRVIAGYVQREKEPKEAPNSFPAIEAFVNSYGRVWMADVRAQVGEEHVLYQHTDSLHLTETGFGRLQMLGLVRDGELGYFRHQGTYAHVTYRGVSDYTLDGRHVVSGLPGEAVELPGGGLAVTTWEGPAGVIHRGPDGTITSYREVRRLTKLHARGRVCVSGAVLPAEVWATELNLRGPAYTAPCGTPKRTRKRSGPRA